MSDIVFVDTNVLVYARDASEPAKQPVAREWIEHLWRERTGRLSFQVLQEFYVTVTSKLDPGLEPAAARNEVRTLLTWRPVLVNEEVVEGAWRLQDRYGLAWWDALIVAAAQISRASFLLSEDFQHEQVIGDVRVISPFESKPGDLETIQD